MTIRAIVNGREYPVYNTATFSARLDEELDTGSIQILSNEKTPFPDYSLVKVTIIDGADEQTYDFYAFDSVEQRRSDYFVHTLELVELSRLLMGVMIDGIAVTQPIEGSGEAKKTLKDVVTDILRKATLLKAYKEDGNWYTEGRRFVIAPSLLTDKTFATTISPEFQWSAETLLWECLCDIGNVIDCIPRLTIGTGANPSLYVNFEKINDVKGVYEV